MGSERTLLKRLMAEYWMTHNEPSKPVYEAEVGNALRDYLAGRCGWADAVERVRTAGQGCPHAHELALPSRRERAR